MRHFKLIQFVFTNDRDILKPNIEFKVENPTEPPALKESQHIKLWQYQQQYNAIEEKEAENAKSKEQQKEALMRDIETKRLQSIDKASSAPLTKEVNHIHTNIYIVIAMSFRVYTPSISKSPFDII